MTEPTEEHAVAIAAEQGVLGAVLLDNGWIRHDDVSTLAPYHFWRVPHRLIWSAMVELDNDGEAIDQPAIAHKLGPEGLQKIGDSTYLLELIGARKANAARAARIIRDESDKRRRRSIVAGAELDRKAGVDGWWETLVENVRAYEEGADTSTPWDDLFRPAGDLVFTKPPPPECLLEMMPSGAPYLRMGTAGLFVAPGGTGKSFALLQLGVSIVTGKDWFGLRPAKTGPVSLIFGEDSSGIFHERLHAVMDAYHLDDDQRRIVARDLNYMTLADIVANDPEHMATGLLQAEVVKGKTSQISATRFYRWLQHRLSRAEWRLIVLDPMSQFLGAGLDSNRDTDATRFVVAVRALTRLPGNPPVLVAHHTGKGRSPWEQESQRGSSAFTDGFRWQANLGREKKKKKDDEGDDDNELELRISKTNTGVYHKIKLRRGAGGVLGLRGQGAPAEKVVL